MTLATATPVCVCSNREETKQMGVIIIVLALFALLCAAVGAFPGSSVPYALPFAVVLLAVCVLLLVYPTLRATGATMLLFPL